MMIISNRSAKRRHGVLWLVFLVLIVGSTLGFFTANLSWPSPRQKAGGSG